MALRPIPLAVSQELPSEVFANDPDFPRRYAYHSQLVNTMALPNAANARSPVTLVPTPGFGSASASFTGKITYAFRVPGSTALWVLTYGAAGASTCRSSAGAAIALPAGVTYAFKAVANSTHILVIGLTGICYVNIGAASATAIATGWNATDVAWQDGYGILTRSGTDQFFITGNDDLTTIGGLDYSSADASQDTLVGCCSFNRELWLFGQNSIEIWANTGNASFPFERGQVHLNLGCIPRSNIVAGRRLCWIGDDRAIYTADGYSPRQISNPGIQGDMLARCAGTASDPPYVCTYQAHGYDFFAVTPKAGGPVYNYNLDAGFWHTLDNYACISVRDDAGAWWFASSDAGTYPYLLKLDPSYPKFDSFLTGAVSAKRPLRRVDLPLLASSGCMRTAMRQMALDIQSQVSGDTITVKLMDDVGDPTYFTLISKAETSQYGSGQLYGTARYQIWRLGSYRQRMVRIEQAWGNYDVNTHNPLVVAGVWVDTEEMAS